MNALPQGVAGPSPLMQAVGSINLTSQLGSMVANQITVLRWCGVSRQRGTRGHEELVVRGAWICALLYACVLLFEKRWIEQEQAHHI